MIKSILIFICLLIIPPTQVFADCETTWFDADRWQGSVFTAKTVIVAGNLVEVNILKCSKSPCQEGKAFIELLENDDTTVTHTKIGDVGIWTVALKGAEQNNQYQARACVESFSMDMPDLITRKNDGSKVKLDKSELLRILSSKFNNDATYQDNIKKLGVHVYQIEPSDYEYQIGQLFRISEIEKQEDDAISLIVDLEFVLTDLKTKKVTMFTTESGVKLSGFIEKQRVIFTKIIIESVPCSTRPESSECVRKLAPDEMYWSLDKVESLR